MKFNGLFGHVPNTPLPNRYHESKVRLSEEDTTISSASTNEPGKALEGFLST